MIYPADSAIHRLNNWGQAKVAATKHNYLKSSFSWEAYISSFAFRSLRENPKYIVWMKRKCWIYGLVLTCLNSRLSWILNFLFSFHRFVFWLPEDGISLCWNVFYKLKAFAVFLKFLICFEFTIIVTLCPRNCGSIENEEIKKIISVDWFWTRSFYSTGTASFASPLKIKTPQSQKNIYLSLLWNNNYT